MALPPISSFCLTACFIKQLPVHCFFTWMELPFFFPFHPLSPWVFSGIIKAHSVPPWELVLSSWDFLFVPLLFYGLIGLFGMRLPPVGLPKHWVSLIQISILEIISLFSSSLFFFRFSSVEAWLFSSNVWGLVWPVHSPPNIMLLVT